MLIIGKKINATIPKTKKAIIEHDEFFLKRLAADQERAGAGCIDINVGTGDGDRCKEISDMAWLVDLVKTTIQGKICVDSADPKVLEAGIKTGGERVGIVNSIKATDKSICSILPLVAENKIPVIALAMDEDGIPKEVPARLKACEKIMKAAERFGVSSSDIFFDPLVMPVGTDISQGNITLETLKGIKREFPDSKTVLALSNISFGLPKRSLINSALLSMAMYLSVDALIVDPLDKNLMGTLKAAELVLGKDRHCRRYIRAFRQANLIPGAMR